VLTFLEEVGQHDSWWWIGIVVLFNLLAVRLVVRLVTFTVLGCLHQLRLVFSRWHAGGVLVQGEGAMDPFLCTYRGVTLRVAYGYPNRYHLYYTIDASRADEQATGWVRYAHLSRSGATIEAGCEELPADYGLLWRVELCREAGINPCEESTPAELAAAFRLVEACASFEVREQAAASRRQAKLMRTGQEMARWNTWVGQ